MIVNIAREGTVALGNQRVFTPFLGIIQAAVGKTQARTQVML